MTSIEADDQRTNVLVASHEADATTMPPPPACFVQNIPPELLLLIFSYCQYFDTCPTSLRTPCWLQYDDATWRHVSNSHGSLWSEILVDNEGWTKLYIERSRNALLHLAFDPWAERYDFGEDEISEPRFIAACSTLNVLHRVRELDISGPVNAGVLDVLFTSGSERAEDVLVEGVTTVDLDNPDGFIPVPNALRTLSLKRFATDHYLRLLHAPLTSLSLTKTSCGPPQERLIDPLVELLRQLPTLEHLEVISPIYKEEDYHVLGDPRGPHFPKTPLPNLKSLEVQDELPQALSLIESFELPSNVKLTLISEAWGDYDEENMMHESATKIPSYDPRLRVILDAQYSAACKKGARFTRLDVRESCETEATVSPVAIELCDPSSSPLPESVVLTADCEIYTCRDAFAQALLRLLPIFPALDSVHTLELHIDMGVEGWRETSRLLTAITHLTVAVGHALYSLLCADEDSEKPLLPRLECVSLDGCVSFEQWGDFCAFLRRRGPDAGRTIQWQATRACFRQTEEEEQELLEHMESEGFAPLKWCRPGYFEYEKVPRKTHLHGI